MANLEHFPEAKRSRNASHALGIAAIVLRTLFIVLLLVLTLRVSLPQSETIWTAYDTPADLVRLILGLGVCAWLVYQLFQVPKDAGSARTWLYLGLVAVPFTLITLFAVW
jgi:TRAP-type C4-dicarboxylate transport system permease small subunit